MNLWVVEACVRLGLHALSPAVRWPQPSLPHGRRWSASNVRRIFLVTMDDRSNAEVLARPDEGNWFRLPRTWIWTPAKRGRNSHTGRYSWSGGPDSTHPTRLTWRDRRWWSPHCSRSYDSLGGEERRSAGWVSLWQDSTSLWAGCLLIPMKRPSPLWERTVLWFGWVPHDVGHLHLFLF